MKACSATRRAPSRRLCSDQLCSLATRSEVSFLTPLGDVYGRKLMNSILNILQGLGIWLITLQLAFNLATFWGILSSTFIFGFASAAHYNISSQYVCEFTTSEHQKLYSFRLLL